MAETIEASIDDEGSIELPESLTDQLRDPRELLRKIGILYLEHARRAFDQQRLGDFEWPERYPGQSGAKLNIAGAIKDLAEGPQIAPHRFKGRPAGVDTGALKDSLDAESDALNLIGEATIQVGSTIPYAPLVQSGGISAMPITRSAKLNLVKLLRGSVPGKEVIRERLGFILNKKLNLDTLIQRVHARPFIGMTDDLKGEIESLVEKELASEHR